MVKIFKEESSNEEKENNQSDLYFPIIVLFVIFQKQFMQQGITDGSIKG